MTSTVDRVKKLIALAASPFENEARTSAWLACKLIRENNLDVSEVVQRAAWAPPPPPPAAQHPAAKRRVIRAKYLSVCRVCFRSVAIGDPIFWAKGEGATHVRCQK